MNANRKEKLHENPIKRHLVVGGVILFFIVIFYVFTDYGVINKYSYIQDRNELLEKSEILKNQIDSLKKLEQQLKTDTLTIEKLAREKYGMIKPKEKVIFIKKANDQ